MNKMFFLLILLIGNIGFIASDESLNVADQEQEGVTLQKFVEEVLSLVPVTKKQSIDTFQKKLNDVQLPDTLSGPAQENEDEVRHTDAHILRMVHALKRLHMQQFIAELDCFVAKKTPCFKQFKNRLIVRMTPWMIDRFIQRINKKVEGQTCFPGIELSLKKEQECEKNKAVYQSLKAHEVFQPFIVFLQSLASKGFVQKEDLKRLAKIEKTIEKNLKVALMQSFEDEDEDNSIDSHQIATFKNRIFHWYKRQAIKVRELAV